jgi:uncharacterized membrane protein YphA (DoxX/SURF4 family)
MKKSLYVDITSGLLILLFIYAAASKLMDYQKFRVQIGQSPLLTAYAGFWTWLVPVAEVVVSVMLAVPTFKLTGLYLSFSLLVMFSAYITTIKWFSDYVPCSCGGVLQHMSWGTHLVFNIFFVILSASAILVHPNNDIKEVPYKNI